MKVWFYSLFKLKSCCRALSGMNRLDPVRSLLNLEATQGVTCHDGAGGLTLHGSSEGCDGFSFRSRKAVVSRTRRICAPCKMFVANGFAIIYQKVCTGSCERGLHWTLCFVLLVPRTCSLPCCVFSCLFMWRGYFRTGQIDEGTKASILEDVVGTAFPTRRSTFLFVMILQLLREALH